MTGPLTQVQMDTLSKYVGDDDRIISYNSLSSWGYAYGDLALGVALDDTVAERTANAYQAQRSASSGQLNALIGYDLLVADFGDRQVQQDLAADGDLSFRTIRDYRSFVYNNDSYTYQASSAPSLVAGTDHDDASLFEIDGTELLLRAGSVLGFDSNPSLDLTVEVDDTRVGATPHDTAALSIAIGDGSEVPMATDKGFVANERGFVGTTAAGDPDAEEVYAKAQNSHDRNRIAEHQRRPHHGDGWRKVEKRRDPDRGCPPQAHPIKPKSANG